MKIGILTFHNGYNYGAFAQAFALQKYLLDLNGQDNVEIINYKNLVFTLREYKYFLLKKSITEIIYNLKKIFKFKSEQKLLSKTKRIYFDSSLYKYKFDVVFFGSDSIWNYTNEFAPNDLVYFGKNINSNIKASYAASFGPDKFEDGYPKKIEKLINEFNYLGARDNNTKSFVSNFLEKDKNVSIVLDPTFLIDFRKYSKKPKLNNYILIYCIELNKNQIDTLKKLSYRTGKKLVSVGYTLDWCDISFPNISPFEWIGYIEQADFVFTSMYHGTLLSCQLNKNFATFVTKYRKNKIVDILNRLNLAERIIEDNDMEYIEKVYSKAIEYDAVNKKIQLELNFSKKYIKNILEDLDDEENH